MRDLSIVIPTCQRAVLLDRCIQSIERNTRCDYEIVVVDGASTDGTAMILDQTRQRIGDRLVVVHEAKREGFVRGINKGFRAASGRFMIWLNDDARPLGPSLDQALEQMTACGPDVGLVALFHAWHGLKNVAYETRLGNRLYRLLHVRGTLYANFGLGLRETFAKLNYFDERYFVQAADPDFSLKVWNAGLKVEPAYLTAVDHDEHVDERRTADIGRIHADNEMLFAKWNLPSKNLARNDFDPDHPCTLHGLREIPTAKAG
jgi:GT2 family glycosyltransferase